MNDKGEQALIPQAPSKKDTDLLKETKEAFIGALEIPASEGKESAKILPKPVFFRLDHGVKYISYDKDTQEQQIAGADAVYYASYLFRTNDGEVRFITVPVATYEGEDSIYNNPLISRMTKQGFNRDDIKKCTSSNKVQKLFGLIDAHQMADIEVIFATREFEISGFHPREGDRLNSGWDPYRKELTFIGKEYDTGSWRENPFFHGDDVHQYPPHPEGIKQISKPLDPHTKDPFELELVKRCLESNKKI